MAPSAVFAAAGIDGGAQTSSRGTAISSCTDDTQAAADENAIAIGCEAFANAGSVAVGFKAKASDNDSVAIGIRANTAQKNGVAIGKDATASNADDVALGSNSTTSGAVKTSSATIGGKTYNFAGSTPGSVVSVGNAGNERQITNVAAGQLSGTSTDAINGSQLFATNTAVSSAASSLGQLGSSAASALGGGVTYNSATGVLSSPTYSLNGSNYNNVGAALSAVNAKAVSGWNLRANGDTATNVAPGSTVELLDGQNVRISRTGNSVTIGTADDLQATSLTAGNSVINSAGLSVLNGPGGTVTLTSSGLNNGNNKITNVGAGQLSGTSTDAVNGSQLFATNTAVSSSASSLGQLGSSAASALGGGVTYNSATGVLSSPTYSLNGSNYNNVGAALSAVNAKAVSGWNLRANGDTETNVAPGSTVELLDGQNVRISRTGNSVTIGTADDLQATSLTAGNSVINSAGLSVLNGPGGTVTLTSSGLNNGNNKITNVAAGQLSGTSTDAVNGSQLYALQQQADLPITFTGNEGSVARKLGQTIHFGGSAATQGSYSSTNIKTVVDDKTGSIELQFAESPKFGNLTVNDNGKITGLTAGTDDTDAVNVSQLKTLNATVDRGWDISASGENSSTVKPGDSVDFKSADGNLNITKNATDNDVNFSLARNINIDSITAGNTVFNGNGITVNGKVNLNDQGLMLQEGPSILTSGIDAGNKKITNLQAGVDDTDAVNLSQLKSTVAGSRTHYFGSNDGGTNAGNYNGEGASGLNSVASGINALASGSGSVATGADSVASSVNSVAIGSQAVSTAEGSIALGSGSSDGDRGSESYTGKYTNASNITAGTVSVGNAEKNITRTISNVADAKEQTDAVNLRQLDGAVATANKYTDDQIKSVNAIGLESATQVKNISEGKDGLFQVNNTSQANKPLATGNDAVAGGAGAIASGNKSLALGSSASANAANSVAIGSGSSANRSNTVSVGSAGKERQITNVAEGTQATDAVNVNQLRRSEAGSVRYAKNSDGSTDYSQVKFGDGKQLTTLSGVAPGVRDTDATNVHQLKQSMAYAKNYTDRSIKEVRRDAYGGTAAAIATANLPQSYTLGGSMTSLGLGTYQGQSAIAVGVSTLSDNGRWVFKLSGTSSTRGDNGMGAGIGFQW